MLLIATFQTSGLGIPHNNYS